MAKTLDTAVAMSKLQDLVDRDEMSQEDIADTMEALEMELTDKVDAICDLIEQAKDKSTACKSRVQQYQQRQKMWENKTEGLRKYLLMCIQAAERKSIKTVYHTVSVKSGASKIIVPEVSKLPEEYQIPEVSVKADTDKIKKAVDAGNVPEGVTVEPGNPTLSIR
jgi:hypothetical protein